MASSASGDSATPSEQANSKQNLERWYIVKQPSGVCQILSVAEASEFANWSDHEKWGPFQSQGEAIARRVGLIRAGKCQPQ
jgi:hypothetical protein